MLKSLNVVFALVKNLLKYQMGIVLWDLNISRKAKPGDKFAVFEVSKQLLL